MKKLILGLLVMASFSSFAADRYSCQVIGQHVNYDNEVEPLM